MSSGSISCTELCALYLHRISAFDTRGPFLNSVPRLNPNVFAEAAASDTRRAAHRELGPLDGIPYTLKDSFKYTGMTVASGSPAFFDLRPNEDAHIARQLKEAGAVLIGKTNMPPMAAGGMQRGLYGRAESPYNLEYLTAAFSSGSSNGCATSTAASFAAFGLGSETVSSGRSPASNNGLVCYTPSRGVLSCRGLWPLYVTCDVPVPQTRTVDDMLVLLDVLTQPDPNTTGDFWREQTAVALPKVQFPSSGILSLCDKYALKGKRLAVPRLYVGGRDTNPQAKHTVVSEEVRQLWRRARADLEALGAICIETDFPLVTNYDDDSTGRHNNVVGAPMHWNVKERHEIVAYAWDDFLLQNKDQNHKSLGESKAELLFPLPSDYIPGRYTEIRNLMDYPALVKYIRDGQRRGKTIFDIEGMTAALTALEDQRKRDLEDWLVNQGLDAVVFPANGDVGRADLEDDIASAEHALQNGVKYSNGNRARRHLGVPTVSVSMGTMESKGMPVNLTFCGAAGSDADLLRYGYAYEQQSQRRVAPPLTPELSSDRLTFTPRKLPRAFPTTTVDINITEAAKGFGGRESIVHVCGTVSPANAQLEVFLDGHAVDGQSVKINEGGGWEMAAPFVPFDAGQPGYNEYLGGEVLANKIMIIVLARAADGAVKGKLLLV